MTNESQEVTLNRQGINARADKAERLHLALTGVNRLLVENNCRKENQGDQEPFMDGFTEGCLYSVLEVIGDGLMELARDIDTLARWQEKSTNLEPVA